MLVSLFAHSWLHIVFHLLLKLLNSLFSAVLWACLSSPLVIVQSMCLNPVVCDHPRCRARSDTTPYHSVIPRWWIGHTLPGLGRRRPSGGTHDITSTNTHTGTAWTPPFQRSCFVQHSSSLAVACLSCEVILRRSLRTSMCAVVLSSIRDITSVSVFCCVRISCLHSHIRGCVLHKLWCRLQTWQADGRAKRLFNW